jgi:hypothetical protein
MEDHSSKNRLSERERERESEREREREIAEDGILKKDSF